MGINRKKHHLIGMLIVACILMLHSMPVMAKDNKTIIVDGKVFAVSRDCKGDNWKFDSETHTLSLDGYDGLYIDLGTQEEATIQLSGDNKVASNLESPAIHVSGSLKIEGEGSLSLTTSACHAALYAQGGSLSLSQTTVTVEGTGATENTEYLVMSDGPLSVQSSALTIHDKVASTGGAIGNTSGDLMIEDSKITVDSLSRALVAMDGNIRITGADSVLDLSASESVIYGTKNIQIENGSKVSVHSSGMDHTAVFAPEGEISILSSELAIRAGKTAIASKELSLYDAYLAEPFDGAIEEVSSMQTVRFEKQVCSEVSIRPGPRPTATPTPTPTPTPVPATPTPTPGSEPGFLDFIDSEFSSRTIIGGLLVAVSAIIIIVMIVSKVRNRRY